MTKKKDGGFDPNAPFKESPTGMHRMQDGAFFEADGDDWEEVTAERVAVKFDESDSETMRLKKKLTRTIYQTFIDILTGKPAKVLTIIGGVSTVLGGLGGLAGYKINGGDKIEQHKSMATQAQVDELTNAYADVNTKLKLLDAKVTTIEQSLGSCLTKTHAMEIEQAVTAKELSLHQQHQH